MANLSLPDRGLVRIGYTEGGDIAIDPQRGVVWDAVYDAGRGLVRLADDATGFPSVWHLLAFAVSRTGSV